jgi:uncharacterized protein (TIGR02265 family)
MTASMRKGAAGPMTCYARAAVGHLIAEIKGTQLLGVVKALRVHREQAEPMLPDQLLRYLDERVLVSTWYPDADYRELILVLGRLLAPHVKGNVWRVIGAEGATRDFGDTYAPLIRAGETRWTIEHLPVGWRFVRNTGVLSVHALDGSSARLVLNDYALMCRELAEVTAGYFDGAMGASGAPQHSVDVIDVGADCASWMLRWR